MVECWALNPCCLGSNPSSRAKIKYIISLTAIFKLMAERKKVIITISVKKNCPSKSVCSLITKKNEEVVDEPTFVEQVEQSNVDVSKPSS